MLLLYFALVVVLAGSIFWFRNRKITQYAALTFIPIQLIFSWFLIRNYGTTVHQYFTIDSAGILFCILLSIISITTISHSFRHIGNAKDTPYSVFFGSLIALTGVVSGAYLANSFTLTWVFVEASTLFAALLIYHARGMRALEATWKYVFVCSVGIALAYMGILFLSATLEATGEQKADFNTLTRIVEQANPIYLKIAFIFVLTGYATKMELFPMHTIGIDANTVAPATASAFISTGLVNLGFLAIFRVYGVLAKNAEVHLWMNKVLIIAGIGSLLAAAGYMMKARHKKRMLAYSTMENMGIVAIAIGAGGVGYYAAILHIIIHSFVKLAFFLQTGQASRVTGTYWIAESGNYLKKYPLGGISFLLAFISVVAIPPSGLFYTELIIFKSLITANLWWVVGAMVIFICFVVYGMATRVSYILFSNPQTDKELTTKNVSKTETFVQLALLLTGIMLCFYRPEWLNLLINNLIHEIVR